MRVAIFLSVVLVFIARAATAQWLENPHTLTFSRPDLLRTQAAPQSRTPASEISHWLFPNINVTRSETYGQYEPSVVAYNKHVLIGLIDDSDLANLSICTSTDGGLSFERALMPQRTNETFDEATDPSLALGHTTDGYSNAYYVNGYSSGLPNVIGCFHSSDFGNNWTQLTDVYQNLQGSDTSSDKYYIAVDSVRDRIYVTWVEQAGEGYTSIVSSCSTNGGESWAARKHITGLGHFTCPIPAVAPDGTVLVTFVDYFRNNRIFVSRSTDGGATYATPQIVGTYVNLGPLLPDDSLGYQNIGTPDSALAVNSFPSIAIDRFNIHAYITWCARGADDHPHVWLTTSSDVGQTWSTPQPIETDSVSTASARFFPWIATGSRGEVAIAYYASTMNTVAPKPTGDDHLLQADLFMAHSTDNGATFHTRRISNATFDPLTGEAFRPVENSILWFFGDYIGLATTDSTWYPVWCDARSGDAEIYTSIVQPFAPLPVTNLTLHDTVINGKPSFVLSWNYDPATTFGYPLSSDYQFLVTKDTSTVALLSGSTLHIVDTNISAHEYHVTVLAGRYRSITDSIGVKNSVSPYENGGITISIGASPARVGHAETLTVRTKEDSRVAVTFYDELGRALLTNITDGVTGNEHTICATPNVAGTWFYLVREYAGPVIKEVTGKLTVLPQ